MEEKKRKLLEAVLDIIILAEMSNRIVMSIPDIITFLSEKHSIQISAGTIYHLFRKMEKKEHIKRIPKEKKKIYAITKSGKDLLKAIQQNAGNFQLFIADLIEDNKINKNF